MNNSEKKRFAAVVVFLLVGLLIVIYFRGKANKDLLTSKPYLPTTHEKNVETKTQEKKVGLSKSNEILSTQKKPLKLLTKVQLDPTTEKVILKRFSPIAAYDTNTNLKEKLKNSIEGTIGYWMEEDIRWQKAELVDEKNGIKFIFFYNFFNCTKDFGEKIVNQKFDDGCYFLQHIAKYNEISRMYAAPDGVVNYLWKDDCPYLLIRPDKSAAFLKDSNVVAMLISISSENRPTEILKYNGDSYIWETAEALVWQKADENEFKKLARIIDSQPVSDD